MGNLISMLYAFEDGFQLDQSVRECPPANLVFVFKHTRLWVEGGVAHALKMILDDEIQHSRVLVK